MAHHVAATPAIKKTTGELPEPPVGGRGSAIILYRLAGSVHPLPRNAGVRHGHSYPFLPRLHRVLAPPAVAPPVDADLGDLALLPFSPIEPPDAVEPVPVQAGGHLRATIDATSSKVCGRYASSRIILRKNVWYQNLPPPGAGTPSRSKAFFTAFMVRPSTPTMRNTRRTMRISSSCTT